MTSMMKLSTSGILFLKYNKYLLVILFLVFSIVNYSVVQYQQIKRTSTDQQSVFVNGEIVQNRLLHMSSSLCSCRKQIPIDFKFLKYGKNQQSTTAFNWCSKESSIIRGHKQKVITYSLYGNDTSAFDRYFSLMDNISKKAAQVYPGWTIRIYHNIEEKQNPIGYQVMCKIYCNHENVDLCSINEIAAHLNDRNDRTSIEPDLVTGLNPKMFRFLVYTN